MQRFASWFKITETQYIQTMFEMIAKHYWEHDVIYKIIRLVWESCKRRILSWHSVFSQNFSKSYKFTLTIDNKQGCKDKWPEASFKMALT